MKITTLLIFAAFMQVSAIGLAQRLTLVQKDATIRQVFKEINKQTGYNVFWSDSQLSSDTKIAANFKETPLLEVLNKCLENTSLTYTIEDKTVVIKEKKVTFIDKVKEAFAEVTVSGKVQDETGQPMIGVTVKIRDTQQATATDKNGTYTITVPNENTVIAFSFVGFESQELKAKDIITGSIITMKAKLTNLHEVIINKGYYNERQELSTGSIGTLTAREIEQTPASNPLVALEARIPGLQISQSTGAPGSSFFIQIRGQNSILNGNQPYFIIDGVPYESMLINNLNHIGQGGSPMSFINPGDIESISVLKDADATAIYGSKAANGAILITTKKGKPGSSRINLNVSSGISTVGHTVQYLNTEQYLQIRHEAFKNDASTPQSYDYDINGIWDTTRYTNWQKLLIGGTAHYTDVQGSISGGSTNTQYLVSGNFNRQTTIYPALRNNANNRGGMHFSLNSTSPDQKLTFQFIANYIADASNLPQSDPTAQIGSLPPNAPLVYNTDGTLNWANSTWPNGNPMAYLLQTYQGKTYDLVGNAMLSYQILPGLNIRTTAGYHTLQQEETILYPLTSYDPAYATTGNSDFNNSNSRTWTIEPQLDYRTQWGKNKISAFIGSSFQNNSSQGQQINASGFSSDALLRDMQAASSLRTQAPINNEYRYTAIYGRLNYNWDDKYLINFTARRDGSSRFGPGKQFGNFGAAGAAWIFSHENFIKNNFSFLSFGKLRASYGTTGNDGIPDYAFINLYNPNSNHYGNDNGLIPTRLFNPDLAWEINKKLEFGIELGWFGDRINISANYYRNRSSNQLINTVISSVTGFASIQSNQPAIVQNVGQEYSLNTLNIESANFSWRSTVTFSFNRNKLVAYPGLINTAIIVGQPLSILKLYNFAGVNQQNGEYQFLDAKGNLTQTPDYNTDRTVLIDPTPKYFGSFQNSFRYRQFSIDIFLQIVNQKGQYFLYNGYPGSIAPEPTTILQRWQKPGDITNIQRLNQDFSLYSGYDNATNSNQLWGDASYVRLKNISFSWQIPDAWCHKVNVKDLKFYIQGENISTWTKYIGYDPETGRSTVSPLLMTIVAGIKLTL